MVLCSLCALLICVDAFVGPSASLRPTSHLAARTRSARASLSMMSSEESTSNQATVSTPKPARSAEGIRLSLEAEKLMLQAEKLRLEAEREGLLMER
jgi:hypothetical protein